MKKEEKISIENFNDVVKFVDGDFAKVLILLSRLGIISEEKIKRTFEDKKEIKDFLENLIVEYLNEKYFGLHGEISELRKKGKDLTEATLKLSEFKLKLKLFRANLDEHSFNQVVLILKNTRKFLDEFSQTVSRK